MELTTNSPQTSHATRIVSCGLFKYYLTLESKQISSDVGVIVLVSRPRSSDC